MTALAPDVDTRLLWFLAQAELDMTLLDSPWQIEARRRLLVSEYR